jgi:type IV secretory pathway TrbD component
VYPALELRLLRYVVAVAEELHFSRAALRVRVAQPSLSKQIRDLEEGLGVSLFNRSNRNVQITQAGRDFVKEAVKALLYADRAVEAAKQAENAENGLLSVGYTPRINLRVVSTVRALSASERWGLKLAFISSERVWRSCPSSSEGSPSLSAKAVVNARSPESFSALACPSWPSIFLAGCSECKAARIMMTLRNPVYRTLNRPLTILGAERKLFFFALVIGACVFNLLNSLVGALAMFFAFYLFARWATQTDPQILRFLLNSTKVLSTLPARMRRRLRMPPKNEHRRKSVSIANNTQGNSNSTTATPRRAPARRFQFPRSITTTSSPISSRALRKNPPFMR